MSMFRFLRRTNQCCLCSNHYLPQEGRVLVKGRADHDMSSVIFETSEKAAINGLNSLGVKVLRLEDIRRDIFACTACIENRIVPVLQTRLATLQKAVLSPCGASIEKTTILEEIDGIGSVGVPDALFLLLDAHATAKPYLEKFHANYIANYVVPLCAKLVANGLLAAEKISNGRKKLFADCLKQQMDNKSAYGWSYVLDDIAVLIEKSVINIDSVREKLDEWAVAAARRLSSGKDDKGWGSSVDVQEEYATEVKQKIQTLISDSNPDT